MDFIDVAIIGGGPAGLTAAAALARQLQNLPEQGSNSYAHGPYCRKIPSLEIASRDQWPEYQKLRTSSAETPR